MVHFSHELTQFISFTLSLKLYWRIESKASQKSHSLNQGEQGRHAPDDAPICRHDPGIRLISRRARNGQRHPRWNADAQADHQLINRTNRSADLSWSKLSQKLGAHD